MKLCKKCGEVKSLSMFHKDKSSADGLRTKCKGCVAALDASRWARDKQRLSAQSKAWREKNPECVRELGKRWCAENPDLVKARKARYAAKHAEKVALRLKNWREKNPEKVKASSAKWNKGNPAAAKAYQDAYYQANRAMFFANNAKRRALTKEATPVWASMKRIAKIYREAEQATDLHGEQYHVDHIVPLNSKLVCGLHCEANLRVITAKENGAKRNFYWPDMPEQGK